VTLIILWFRRVSLPGPGGLYHTYCLLKEPEKQIPHRLKPVRDDKNKGPIRRT